MNPVIAQWDAAAQVYEQMQETDHFALCNREIVRERFPDASGLRVLDLGCGGGWYTDYFSSIGAACVGVDGSAKMIETASDRYPDRQFVLADITQSLPFADNSFDLVFCNQVLMDIDPLEPVFAEVRRVLRIGGTFYWGIVHPAFYDSTWQKDETGYCYAKTMRRYIGCYPMTNEFWGETSHFHRPISYYLNLAAEYGFTLCHIEEPESYDGIEKNADLPLFLFAEFRKTAELLCR